jgi:hypothetical protein
MVLRIGQQTVVVDPGQEITRNVQPVNGSSVVQARVVTGPRQLAQDKIWHLEAWRRILPHLRKILDRGEIGDAFACFMKWVESQERRIFRDDRDVAQFIWKNLHPPPTIFPFTPGFGGTVMRDPTPFTVMTTSSRKVRWQLTDTSGKWLCVTQKYGTCIEPGDGYVGIYTYGLQQCVALVYIYYEKSVTLDKVSEANVVGVAMFHVMSGAIFAMHDPRVLGKPIVDKYPNAMIVGVMSQGQGYTLPGDSVTAVHQMLPPGSPLYTMDAQTGTFAVRLDGTFGTPSGVPNYDVYKPVNQ